MRSTVQAEIERLRTQRAAEWLEIMQGEDPEPNHAEFVRWITESPLNMNEFLKLDALSRETRAVLNSAQLDRQTLLQTAAARVVQLEQSASLTVPRTQRTHFSRLRAIVAAAGVAAAIALGWWVYGEFAGWDIYVAGPTEQRRIDLADGSRVYLNAQTRLAIRFSDTQRALHLSNGEALFDVAKDRDRPFRVQTSDAIVEAVGTQFNVNARTDGTRVAVIEGKVRISRGASHASSSAGTPSTALIAGEVARITPVGAIERDHSVNVATATAWSRSELVFDGTPLEQAVEQFNRHRRSKQLRLEGIRPGSHHYTGLFDAADSEAFAELLSREHDLQVEVRADEIVIRPRN